MLYQIQFSDNFWYPTIPVTEIKKSASDITEIIGLEGLIAGKIVVCDNSIENFIRWQPIVMLGCSSSPFFLRFRFNINKFLAL